MKFCQPHWDQLRAEIDHAGLSQFVAKDSAEIVRKTIADLEGYQKKTTFDPLMGAHWSIVVNVMNVVGIDLLLHNEDRSERCPICYLTADHLAHCTDPGCVIKNYDHWIGFSVGEQAQYAKEHGLLGDA